MLFECGLVHCTEKFGILDYIIDRPCQVGEIKLRPGDTTRAFYWTERPYTLYAWQLQKGRTIYYFNVADSVSLTPREFVWRDLVVDILIDSDQNIHILEQELPQLSPNLSRYIESAKRKFCLSIKVLLMKSIPGSHLPSERSAPHHTLLRLHLRLLSGFSLKEL